MRRLLILALPLVAAACSNTRVDAPSLLPRAVEARDPAEPDPAPVVTVADPAFDAKVTERSRAFDAALAAFNGALRSSGPRVARGARAAPASDTWLDAQAALSEVGAARATADTALAELEALAIERAAGGQPPQAALDAKIAAGNSELERAAAAVERLQGMVSPL